MQSEFHSNRVVAHRLARQLALALAPILTVALLATLPTTPASAAAASKPSQITPAEVSVLPSGEVEELLSAIPLSDLSSTQLTEALSKLPGLSSLPLSKLKEAVSKAVEDLTNKNATVGELLEAGAIEPTLESELKKLLSLNELGSLLKGESLSTKLTGALDSVQPSQLLDTLLSSSGSPEQLLTALFSKLNLEKLLDSTLTGEPFSKMTVGELAGELGMTPTTLAKELDTTTTELPEAATALTAPLNDGKTLGVLDGVGKVAFGVLGGSEGKEGNKETTKESSTKEAGKENGDSVSKETTKEADSSGSAATPSTTTFLVSVPLTRNGATQSSSPPTTGSASKSGKVKILSHHVRGRTVTLVVQVPAAGKLALDGKGLSSVRRETAKAERVTLRTTLTKASAASLRRHHHSLRVKLEVSFKIAGGASSSALLAVNFA